MENLITDVNQYLRNNKVKNQGDACFLVVTHSLLQQGLYRGFNYYKDGVIGDKVIPILAGSSENFEYLQVL